MISCRQLNLRRLSAAMIMQRQESEVSEKSSARSEMTDAVIDEMSEIVREAMGCCPAWSIKERMAYAARALGIEFRRVRGLYYKEARAILAHEADRLRAWRHDYIAREAAAAKLRLTILEERQKALKEKKDAMDMAR